MGNSNASTQNDRMPNFLIIGAARSGTSSLYEYMNQHPDIFFSANKEPLFFAFDGDKVDFKGPGDNRQVNIKTVTELASYQDLFSHVTTEKAIGEASADYLYAEKAPECIHHYIPDAKLVAVLRNPVERAYSSFLYTIRDDREPLRDFAEALAQEDERVAAHWEYIWHYRRMGYYYQHLSRYYRLFNRSQIRIYLNEDLRQDTLSVLRDAFAFLEVDDTFKPDISIAYNEGGFPRRKLLNRLLTRQSRFKSFLRPFMPAFIMKNYIQLKYKNLDKPELSGELKLELARAYKDDILKLQDLIQKDLSSWLHEV